ncbi:UPF0149 family protein [Litorivicinus lipolyticus]|nr:UPF0149 family protein [Litorivicinus lipolyticus]
MISLKTPLTADDLKALDKCLTFEVGPQGLSVDRLDGLLHALAIGPTTLDPTTWVHMVWGGALGQPSKLSDDALERLTNLVFRRMNQVVAGFSGDEYKVAPVFKTQWSQGRNLSDPTGFAQGFMLGVDLTRGDWAACLDRPSMELLRALGDTSDPVELADIESLQHKHDATHFVVGNLIAIYEFWMPRRIAAKQTVTVKIGRNDPCPCGSGKKHKKCCEGQSATA